VPSPMLSRNKLDTLEDIPGVEGKLMIMAESMVYDTGMNAFDTH
jgi:hypothetical protein